MIAGRENEHGRPWRVGYARVSTHDQDLALQLDALAAAGCGVGFRSLTEAIDTTTPGGRLVFHLFAALGQFERDLIQERTRAGLAAAAARGRTGGRKPAVTDDKLRRAREHIARGLTVREAALRVKVGKTALYRALRAESA